MITGDSGRRFSWTEGETCFWSATTPSRMGLLGRAWLVGGAASGVLITRGGGGDDSRTRTSAVDRQRDRQREWKQGQQAKRVESKDLSGTGSHYQQPNSNPRAAIGCTYRTQSHQLSPPTGRSRPRTRQTITGPELSNLRNRERHNHLVNLTTPTWPPSADQPSPSSYVPLPVPHAMVGQVYYCECNGRRLDQHLRILPCPLSSHKRQATSFPFPPFPLARDPVATIQIWSSAHVPFSSP